MYNRKIHGKLLLKRSTFGHFFTENDVVCGYNALTIVTVYFDSALFPFIAKTTETPACSMISQVPSSLRADFESTLKDLCDAHILVPAEYDELSYLKIVQKAADFEPNIRVLVLHLTDYCNLACRYCFIEGGIPQQYHRQNMTKAVVEAGIDKFAKVIAGRDLPKNPSVVFYGGEPLANQKILKHALDYIQKQQQDKKLPSQMDKIVITNGTLITPLLASFLKERGVMVSVSLDGPEEINDRNRVFHDGSGSFSQTMQGLRLLQEAGLQPTISCVMSRESIPHAATIIRWLAGELKISALGFNHVSIVPSLNKYDPEYEAKFGDALLEVQDIIQAEFPNVYERRMNHKLNNFIDRMILRADCTGCGEQMSVSPDGKIGICQGYMGSRKTFNGSVFDSAYDPLTDEVFKEWSRRSPLNMPQCFACEALATCGGGCPRNADMINGSIWQVDSAFCHFAKKAQEWMIWKKYAVM